jgi:hypothetical protein
MPLYEEYLCKKGSGRGLFEFKTWKLRWCVVDYGSIKFYNSESHVDELRNYSLTGASISSHVDATAHDAPYECVFIIHFSAESQACGSPPEVVLCVETLEEKRRWLDAIAAADFFTPKIVVDEPSSWFSDVEITTLASMLICENYSPIFAFAKTITPSESGPYVDHTLKFLMHSVDLLPFVDICLDRSMSGQVLSTLFRENSVYLRFIVGYLFFIGRDFLEMVVEPHITRIIQHSSIEINPAKISILDSAALGDAEIFVIRQAHCRNSVAKIMNITSALLVAIDSAELPVSVVRVLHRIATLVNRDFPEFMYSGVVNVFFLRFIVASLCSPQKFGLCMDAGLDVLQTRNLSIIAKVVQNIANGIAENKKEPYMQPLSSFVTEQQIYMAKFLTKVLHAGSSLASERVDSPPQKISSLSKTDMQDLQLSANWWIQLIHKSSTEWPAELGSNISYSDLDNSPMRDSIQGQLANWSSIMEGKLVFPRPVQISSLKPMIFSGNAFVIARFNCWCKLDRAMLYGTLYVTRSAFIFMADVFDSFLEILIMRFEKIELITKLNVGNIASLVQLDLNRAFFLDMQSAIHVDFTTDFGSNMSAILFGITSDSNVTLPVDGYVDSSGKKTSSIFAAMYSLLSLSKNRQKHECSETRPSSIRSVGSLQHRSSLGRFQAKRTSGSSLNQLIPQLQLLQDFAAKSNEEAVVKSSRVIHDSIRAHSEVLLGHIQSVRNCYETNLMGTRFVTRDPQILTRADWDAITPFIW